MKTLRRSLARIPVSMLAIVLAVAFYVAAAALFTQTFPATPPGTSVVVTTTCSALTQNGPTSLVVGTSGTVLYTCGAPPSTTTNALTAIAGSATPTFALPAAGTVSLSYVTHSSTATTCTAGTVLTSAVSTTFVAGAYDYCLSYSSYPSAGIATFTVSWT